MSRAWESFEVPDGYRAEIIGGELVVTPAPDTVHRRAQGELFVALRGAVPVDWEVLFEPEWRLERGGVVAMAPQPDLLVVHRYEPHEYGPLLAVEVLSPSDRRRIDDGRTRREAKMDDYAAAGLNDYLEVDPTTDDVTVVRYESHDGRLVEADRSVGQELLVSQRPFLYRITPVSLALGKRL